MGLPDTNTAARKLPASLEANIAAERRRERQAEKPKQAGGDELRLPYLEQPEVTHDIALSKISDEAMRAFEGLYFRLREQDRKIRRYQVMDALMRALEDEAVTREAVSRIRRPSS